MPESGGGVSARLRLIVAGGGIAALAIPLLVMSPGPDVPESSFTFSWWMLALAFVLTELFVINIHVRSEAHSISMGEIPFVLGLAMSSPVALLVGRIVGTTAVLVVHRRQAFHKLVYNIGIIFLETSVAVALYRVLLSGRAQISAAGLGAAFIALLSALMVGVVAVGVAVYVSQPEAKPRAVVRSLTAGTVVGVVSATLAVGGLTLAWQDPLALVLVAAVAGGAYGLLRVYGAMNKRYVDLEAMYSYTSAMDGALATEELLEVTLDQMRVFFGARKVEAVLVRGVGSTVVRLDDEGTHRRPAPPELAEAASRLAAEGSPSPQPIADIGGDVLEHYEKAEMAEGLLGVLAGPAGTATLLVVGPRRDGLDFGPDDLRLLDALGRHAQVSFERGRLVDRLRSEISQKEHQALHDALTGLPNRRHFTLVVENALRRAREEDQRVAVLLIDLDRFKEVNDTLGHQRGDVLLQEMALRLTDTIGEEHVARLGGDEFGVLLRGLEGVNEAVEWSRKISAVLHRPFINEGLAIQVSGSIGIAMAPDHGTDGMTLLRRADVAMYEAKALGSPFEVYDQSFDQYSTRRLAMAAELRSAIETGEITLAYQPKADIATGTIVGVEALARWRHPRHGHVSPLEFVDLAERTGLIDPLTEHVLRTALRDLSRLRSSGRSLGVAVNVAASSLSEDEFPEVIDRLLGEFEISPQLLTLEVTESTMMADSARARLVVGTLRDLGVTLSIDDYGTGYSSLTYLSELPVAEVKMDRSFVTDMAVDERMAKIVSSTIALVHGLGKRVVAEGIENAATWDLLASAGCDTAQGYYLARPMPFDELLSWLEAGAPFEGAEAAESVVPTRPH